MLRTETVASLFSCPSLGPKRRPARAAIPARAVVSAAASAHATVRHSIARRARTGPHPNVCAACRRCFHGDCVGEEAARGAATATEAWACPLCHKARQGRETPPEVWEEDVDNVDEFEVRCSQRPRNRLGRDVWAKRRHSCARAACRCQGRPTTRTQRACHARATTRSTIAARSTREVTSARPACCVPSSANEAVLAQWDDATLFWADLGEAATLCAQRAVRLAALRPCVRAHLMTARGRRRR
jgi:hypothetical protein